MTKTAVLKTRDTKHATPSLASLHQQWRAEAGALGWDAVTLHDRGHRSADTRTGPG